MRGPGHATAVVPGPDFSIQANSGTGMPVETGLLSTADAAGRRGIHVPLAVELDRQRLLFAQLE